jgi:chromosome segregation ATPase
MPQEENGSGSADDGVLDLVGAGRRRRDVDSVKSAFKALEGSKGTVLERIKSLRRELEDSMRARLRVEADLKDTNHQLAESREKIRELEAELASLKGELGTARSMLDEIDKTLH